MSAIMQQRNGTTIQNAELTDKIEKSDTAQHYQLVHHVHQQSSTHVTFVIIEEKQHLSRATIEITYVTVELLFVRFSLRWIMHV